MVNRATFSPSSSSFPFLAGSPSLRNNKCESFMNASIVRCRGGRPNSVSYLFWTQIVSFRGIDQHSNTQIYRTARATYAIRSPFTKGAALWKNTEQDSQSISLYIGAGKGMWEGEGARGWPSPDKTPGDKVAVHFPLLVGF